MNIRLRESLVVGASLCMLCAAHASVTVNVVQSGADVVATSSGTLNTTALTLSATGSGQAFVWPSFPLGSILQLGTATLTLSDGFSGISGPSSFGSGSRIFATSGSGDRLGIVAEWGFQLDAGYVSGSVLNSTATWANATLASLGLIPGTYTWTWGAGASADSYSLIIGAPAPVPEPSSWALLLAGLVSLGCVVRRRPA